MIFQGTVIHGEKIGRTLGYPTANIAIAKDALAVSSGVYAAWVTIAEKKYQGALVILDEPWKVEVHIIDLSPTDLYGEIISIDIVEKVSDIVKIDDVEKLKEKICEDIEKIRKLLG